MIKFTHSVGLKKKGINITSVCAGKLVILFFILNRNEIWQFSKVLNILWQCIKYTTIIIITTSIRKGGK